MEPIKKVIRAIKDTDTQVLFYGGMGIVLIIIGSLILNMSPPNYQVGYSTTAIGFAFFVFAISTDNAKKSAKKTDQILAKLDEIHEELRKKT
jgi:uncharacterized membrane protein